MLSISSRSLIVLALALSALISGCDKKSDSSTGGSSGGASGDDNTSLPELKIQNHSHFERPAKNFSGSIDFVDAMIQTGAAKQHRIYLDRYHGSAGSVSVRYQSFGDAHTPVEGQVSWADGESGRKSFTITTLPATKNGEHRVWIDLSQATGGARLGREDYSRMYIISDNGSLADTAVWVDAEQGNDSNNGGVDTPMRTVTAAIEQADSQSASHVYLKSGIYPIANEPLISTRSPAQHGILLTERESEANRLIIRSAPGQQAIIDGVDNSEYGRLGFYASTPDSSLTENTGNYITLSHLKIRRVVNGIWHHYSTAKYALIYNNIVTELDGPKGTNISGIALWGVESAIAFNNIVRQVRVDKVINGNGVCMQSYRGKNLFLQQNTLSDCYYGIYHKQSAQKDGQQFASLIARRNHISQVSAYAFNLGVQGGFSPGHSYSLISQNIAQGFGVVMQVDGGAETPLGHHNEISHNIFDRRAVSADQAALHVRNYRHTSFFANIIVERDSSRHLHRNLWSANDQTIPSDNLLFDLTDFNIVIDPQLKALNFSKATYNNTVNLAQANAWGIEENSLQIADYPFVCSPDTSCELNWQLNTASAQSTSLNLPSFAPGNFSAGPFLIAKQQIGADFSED